MTPPPRPVKAESIPVKTPTRNRKGSVSGMARWRFPFLLFSKIIFNATNNITEANINSIISDLTLTTKNGAMKAVIKAPAEAIMAGFLEKLFFLMCRNAEFDVAKAPANSEVPKAK